MSDLPMFTWKRKEMPFGRNTRVVPMYQCLKSDADRLFNFNSNNNDN